MHIGRVGCRWSGYCGSWIHDGARSRARGDSGGGHDRRQGNDEFPALPCASTLVRRVSRVNRALQNLPYVKGMVSGLVALSAACDQAVHNKERCISLSTYVRATRARMAGGQACRVFGDRPFCDGCSWLEGLRTVLDRVVDVHEQRGERLPSDERT